jgi:uncharacterized membrane protein YuzA (DUF378 family)
MKNLHKVAYVLLFAGGINWGLVGLFNFDLVDALLGSWPGLVTLVYVLVGVSTVYLAATHKSYCKECNDMKS